MLRSFTVPAAVLVCLVSGCSNDDALVLQDAADDAAAAAATRQILVKCANGLHTAAVALQDAAPSGKTAGWSAATDPGAVAAMRAAWRQARSAGAWGGCQAAAQVYAASLATSLDSRYETALATAADPYLFDGKGFVGMHAIERILWADSIPASATAFEVTLPNYTQAAFPLQASEAQDFKNQLCGQLVSDAASFQKAVEALTIDAPAGYTAGIDLVKLQFIKLEEAALGKDESRYANFTLDDMRANMATAGAVQQAFDGWLATKKGGAPTDAGAGILTPSGAQVVTAIDAGFGQIQQAYQSDPGAGAGLPPVPPGWIATDITPGLIGAPFSEIFLTVSAAVDDTTSSSLVSSMNQAVTLLGIAPTAASDGGTDAGNGLPVDSDDM
jgi:iron uptake system component EfeO